LTRTAFLTGLILAAIAVGPVAGADEYGPVKTEPQIHDFDIGSLHLTSLRDASFTEANDGKSFGTNAGQPAVTKLLAAAGLPTDRVTLSVNALLVRTGKHLVLIDSGLGEAAGGSLIASLKLAGIDASQLTDVLITHSHFDHVGGLARAQGALAFPHATIRMTGAEWAYLRGRKGHEQLVATIVPRVKTFVPGRELLPGITPVALDGHTPGHVGYEIASGGSRLLDIGDLAHSSVISLAEPEWTIAYDSDARVAERTRRATLTQLAQTEQWVFAPHFPFPGVGRIAVAGKGFKWVPATP
jgi:glyoxylase-like metal-dependent hydrolase (beta-lactamase superfamily II)